MNFSRKVFIVIIATLIAIYSNTVPSAVWPQKEAKDREIGKAVAPVKILISAASSDFKDAVFDAVMDSLKNDSTYIKVTGLKKLSSIKPDDWNAVVIANTCMAWQMDNRVQNFLKAHSSYHSFIILTTSGDPDSCGSLKKIPSNVDAISTASVTNAKTKVVQEVLTAIRKHMRK